MISSQGSTVGVLIGLWFALSVGLIPGSEHACHAGAPASSRSIRIEPYQTRLCPLFRCRWPCRSRWLSRKGQLNEPLFKCRATRRHATPREAVGHSQLSRPWNHLESADTRRRRRPTGYLLCRYLPRGVSMWSRYPRRGNSRVTYLPGWVPTPCALSCVPRRLLFTHMAATSHAGHDMSRTYGMASELADSITSKLKV